MPMTAEVDVPVLVIGPVTEMTPEGPVAPVAPVGGRAAPASATLADDMPDDKWYQVRLAQKRKKFEASHRR